MDHRQPSDCGMAAYNPEAHEYVGGGGPQVDTITVDDDPVNVNLAADSVTDVTGGDELIIDCQKVQLLQKNLERIQTLFKVIVQFGIRAMEDTEKQWISIVGTTEGRLMAKDYIKALCSPGECLPLVFPEELHSLLSHPDIHARLERQSNTAILFLSMGKATIQGADTLAVTLAMSAIEDLILKYQDASTVEPGSPTNLSLESNERLDRELRRLSSQHKEMFEESFDEEALTTLPSAVKRTILKCCIDDSYGGKGTKEDPVYLDKDQTVPMVIDVTQTTPANDFIDLHPKKGIEQGSLSLPSDFGSDSLPESSTNTEESSKENYVTDTPKQTSIAQIPHSSSSVMFVPVPETRTESTPTAEEQPLSPSRQISDHMKSFALNKGYTEEEISAVEKDFGQTLSHAEFISALVMNRRANTQMHAKTVAEIEASHLGTVEIKDQQSAKQNGAWLSESGNTNSTETTSIGATPSTPKSQAKEPPTHTPPHSQGPKTKKGKSAKTNHHKTSKKKGPRKSRWSPNEQKVSDQIDDNSSDLPEVMEVGLSHDDMESPDDIEELPHPIEAILNKEGNVRKWRTSGTAQGPHVDGESSKMEPVMEYLQQLSRDYDEEDCSNIDEVRKRNAERLRILGAFLKSKQEDDDDDDEETEKEGKSTSLEWTTVQRDGKHSSPNKVSHSKEEPSAKLETVHPRQQPQGAQSSKGAVTELQAGAQHLYRQSAASAAVGTVQRSDALDDISLPYLGNIPKPPLQQREQGPPPRPLHPLPVSFPVADQGHHSGPNAPTGMRPFQYVPNQHHMQQSNYAATNHNTEEPQLSQNRNLRYIVIDGSNVAMTHGNHKFFSCKGIRICINYFRRRGHKEITAFVPQWRTHAPRPDYPIRDQHLLEEMRQEAVLVFTPARRVPGKNIVCYDDKFVLRLAQETEGIIVSNDNYRDLWHEKQEWRQLIEDRLLMFSFVADIFMAPDDPLGRNGPDLDTFLRKSQVYEEAFRRRGMHRQAQAAPPDGDWHNNAYGRGRGALQGQHVPGRGQGQYNHGGHYGQNKYGPQQNWYGLGANHPGRMQPTATAMAADVHRPSRPQGQRQRQDSLTLELHNQLLLVFPDSREQVTQLLLKYPYETDLNKLSDHMLDAK